MDIWIGCPNPGGDDWLLETRAPATSGLAGQRRVSCVSCRALAKRVRQGSLCGARLERPAGRCPQGNILSGLHLRTTSPSRQLLPDLRSHGHTWQQCHGLVLVRRRRHTAAITGRQASIEAPMSMRAVCIRTCCCVCCVSSLVHVPRSPLHVVPLSFPARAAMSVHDTHGLRRVGSVPQAVMKRVCQHCAPWSSIDFVSQFCPCGAGAAAFLQRTPQPLAPSWRPLRATPESTLHRKLQAHTLEVG